MKDISLLGCSFPAYRYLGERGKIEFEVVESEKTAQDQLFDVVYCNCCITYRQDATRIRRFNRFRKGRRK